MSAIWHSKSVINDAVKIDLFPECNTIDEKYAAAINEIDKLHRLLNQANKNLYGRKSEKLSKETAQNPLFSFESAAEQTPLESVIEVASHPRRVPSLRRGLPSDLERERIEYDLDEKACSCCGAEMPVIGEEKSEELEFVPARFKVIEHVRLKRACPKCKQGVYAPKLPPEVKPLERCLPGPGLLAQIIISKYQDHLPLHRQEQIFARHRIHLPRQRMSDWIGGLAKLLEPIYQRLIEQIKSLDYFQADETTIKVQDETVKGKLHTGYLWAMLGPPGMVAYHYAKSRAGEVPKKLFEGCKATIQTDAYAGYNVVFLPNGCRRLACMAHIRRKFIEAEASAKSACTQVLTLIAKLYKLEKQSKDLSTDERCALRKKKAFPELRRLYRLLRQLRRATLPQAALSKALQYAWSQKKEVLCYLRDGRFEIDNNQIERQMRPIAVGRKNYLFAGSHDGAHSAAVLYSLINTCKLNKVNAFDYLRDVLVRIHRPGKIEDLLPQNWAAA